VRIGIGSMRIGIEIVIELVDHIVSNALRPES